MVQFGVTLEQQRNQDWKEYYIDYHVRGAKEERSSSRVVVCFLPGPFRGEQHKHLDG